MGLGINYGYPWFMKTPIGLVPSQVRGQGPDYIKNPEGFLLF